MADSETAPKQPKKSSSVHLDWARRNSPTSSPDRSVVSWLVVSLSDERIGSAPVAGTLCDCVVWTPADLTDAVADELKQPFAAVSLAMVYRSLYFFTQAYHRSEATDVVRYLAEDASWLGILKRKRSPHNVYRVI